MVATLTQNGNAKLVLAANIQENNQKISKPRVKTENPTAAITIAPNIPKNIRNTIVSATSD
jgi:hypothetical protein